jgi:hypothetical protein
MSVHPAGKVLDSTGTVYVSIFYHLWLSLLRFLDLDNNDRSIRVTFLFMLI